MSVAANSLDRKQWVWGLILFAAVVLTYTPVCWAGYVWDDDMMLTENPVVIGPYGLKEIWTTGAADIGPLTITTFWLEHKLWGLHPLPYHLVNVFLHGGCAILLWQVLLVLRIPGAFLGAALWALHPVMVESVAWVSELKNTESGFFYLLSILYYLRWLEKKGGFALVLVFAALAMASKSSTVILPLVLCLCAWWQGRWNKTSLLATAPLFCLSIIAGVVSMWTQSLHRAAGGVTVEIARTLPERLAGAGDAVWFYLGKLLWPYPQMAIYPLWKIDSSSVVSYLPLLAVVVVLVVLWLKRKMWARPWFFAFAYLLIALSPGLGLLDNTIFIQSLVFDHFQYLASMGPLALIGAGLVWVANLVAEEKRWVFPTLGAGLAVLFAAFSWQRAWVYQSQMTLWTDTLAKNPACWLAYINIGHVLRKEKQFDRAKENFEKALVLNPNNDITRNNLGDVYLEEGRLDDALVQLRKAIELNPNLSTSRDNLGLALLRLGKIAEGTEQIQNAISLDPLNGHAWNDLGNALYAVGNHAGAKTAFTKALEIDSTLADAHFNLGVILQQEGAAEDAEAHFEKELALNPGDADAHNYLGILQAQKGRDDEALAHFQKATEINPKQASVQGNLGNAMLHGGRIDEAIVHFHSALKIDPNLAEIHNNLGKALLQKQQIKEAIAEFQEALRLKPDYAHAKENLAAALVKQKAGGK